MTPAEMQAAVIRGLKAKTGRDLEEWLALLEEAALSSRKERVTWLKSTHGVGHVTATILADHAAGDAHLQVGPQALLDQLFGKEEEAVRTQLAEVLAFARGLSQVEIVPCKGYVGLRTQRQFAALRPKNGRLEIGLALVGAPEGKVHLVRGLGGGRVTHGIWADEPWRADLEQAYRESLNAATG